MSEHQEGWQQVPPEAVPDLLAVLAQHEQNGLPTTLDYRLRALDVCVAMGHHGAMKFKNVEALINDARVLERFLKEKNLT